MQTSTLEWTYPVINRNRSSDLIWCHIPQWPLMTFSQVVSMSALQAHGCGFNFQQIYICFLNVSHLVDVGGCKWAIWWFPIKTDAIWAVLCFFLSKSNKIWSKMFAGHEYVTNHSSWLIMNETKFDMFQNMKYPQLSLTWVCLQEIYYTIYTLAISLG